MVRIENHLGNIDISREYLVSLIGQTVTSCFGVVNMNTSGAAQDFLSFFKNGNSIDKGVLLRFKKNVLRIDLHIIVRYGTNINAIVDSIKHKVQYAVENDTGFKVDRVNVFIDGMES